MASAKLSTFVEKGKRYDLTRLEGTISKGLATFFEVGQALKEISDRKLWRLGGHKDFVAYAEARWHFKKSRIYQMIQAANVTALVDPPPKNEAIARELVPLVGYPKDLRRAWKEANKANATALSVAEVVRRHIVAVTLKERDERQIRMQTREWPPPQKFVNIPLVNIPLDDDEAASERFPEPEPIDVKFEVLEERSLLRRVLPSGRSERWPREDSVGRGIPSTRQCDP